MQQMLQKQGEPGGASPREPCHMGPPLAHSCPSWNPRPPGTASRLTHKRTHAHTHMHILTHTHAYTHTALTMH